MNLTEDIYSRCYCFAYPMETKKELSTIKVLIIGLRGLGLEVAKNVILNGPKKVDIFDQTKVKMKDLGSNFFLSEKDVGEKNRDEACLEKLSKLNPNVTVGLLQFEKSNNSDENIKLLCKKIRDYNVIIITELYPIYFVAMINGECRCNKIKFIYGICLGLAGYIFTDFGREHSIFDETGKEPETYSIKNITKDKNGLVTIDTIEGTKNFELGNDDFVMFREVEGMTELNEKEFKVIYEDNESFKIGDTSNFGEYKKGGVVYQIKKPKKMLYIDFEQRAAFKCDDFHPFKNSDDTKKRKK